MEAIMDKPLLVSASQDEIEDFSEWRLYLGDSRFDHVGINHGFQVRDFQTSQGTSIIVDSENYRKLQDEASAIWRTLSPKQVVVVVLLYLCFLLVDDSWVVALLLGLVVSLFVTLYRQKIADSRITAVVDSYKEHFLRAYGVELGYGKLNRSDQGRPKVLVRAIYLRRPRRLIQEEVLADGDFEVQDGGRFPPIFIDRTLPGDIYVNEREHDASMKVDAETWVLLQSVHQRMVQTPPIGGFLLFVFYFVIYMVFIWYYFVRVGQTIPQNGYVPVPLVILWASTPVTRWIIDGALDYRKLRLCEEVTRRVNETLQNDENRSHLTVEFHTSDLPGRDKTNSRRYQFVKSGLTTPTKEIV
jgi:hypothetical protein